MACNPKGMNWNDLIKTGNALIGGGAVIFFTFCCPTCDDEVSISEPGRVPDVAEHETCGTKVDVHVSGGWWQAAAIIRKPSGQTH